MGGEWLLEGEALPVMVAQSLLQPTSGNIPVHLLNSTPESDNLFAGKCIGTLQRVKSIQNIIQVNRIDSNLPSKQQKHQLANVVQNAEPSAVKSVTSDVCKRFCI